MQLQPLDGWQVFLVEASSLFNLSRILDSDPFPGVKFANLFTPQVRLKFRPVGGGIVCLSVFLSFCLFVHWESSGFALRQEVDSVDVVVNQAWLHKYYQILWAIITSLIYWFGLRLALPLSVRKKDK